MGFVQTGAGGDSTFLFDIDGNPTITISNVTSGFAAGQTDALDPPPPPTVTAIHADGSGDWEYSILCPSCGSGGGSPNPGPLSFDVMAAGLTPESFISNGTGFFAADICRSIVGTTGACAAGANTGVVWAAGPPTTVPEPATVLIFSAPASWAFAWWAAGAASNLSCDMQILARRIQGAPQIQVCLHS
jgi:hypothetical protein